MTLQKNLPPGDEDDLVDVDQDVAHRQSEDRGVPVGGGVFARTPPVGGADGGDDEEVEPEKQHHLDPPEAHLVR